MNPSPVANDLTSIIILCCNQLDYTRLCVEHVLRHTHVPYELVLVDNGSSDGTPAFLESLRSCPGRARVEVIRNDTNRGFPAGCNQALAQARGRYLVFLNNDTVVTDGWLEGLIAWVQPDTSCVGLVGPTTSLIGNLQQIPIDYNDLAGLSGFAQRRRQEFAGQGLEVPMLSGFCLLVRREVLDRIGGFDERYGLGFYDDNDLCLRARAAGFRLVIALEVFVHHFGGRTFIDLRVDRLQQFNSNRELFNAKFGAERVTESSVRPQPITRRQTTPAGVFAIIWEGAQTALHSMALVNRALCWRLVDRGHDVAILPWTSQDMDTPPLPPILTERVNRPLSRPVDVHVRHHWPPNFTPPPAGHWVVMQPWEYGSLPRAWIGPMTQHVDEVWVYSRFVRQCYLQSGVPEDRVQVVPLGVDTVRFSPQAPPRPLKTAKQFKFLFVGGTIARKGIDVLLEAYARAFTAADDVCLVIKDMGAGSFYRGQTAEELIARHQARAAAPEIEYLDEPLTEEELPGLYTACDCLVHPYRGEGFGLPIAEAMACGLPVIVTGWGAALDFCNDTHAYLIPAREVRFAHKSVGDLETVDYPWVAEPDGEALRHYLRHVVEHPAEARTKGQAGCAHIRGHFTWDHAAEVVERRVRELRQRSIRRTDFQSVGRAGTEAGRIENPSDERKMRVSLSMIVKNEEANLPACLQSAADLVDEIIVVDTGSTDRTKEVAARFHARIFDFLWVDSFAAARNESLCHATGQWVFWLDADDRLDEANRRKLGDLFASLKDDNAAYVMQCLCLPDPVHGGATAVHHLRLFRNHPEVRWEYRVHEQILGAVRRVGGEVRWSDIVIQHSGYQDAATRGRKMERDLRLLRLEDADYPDHPFTLFNFGVTYNELGRPAEALALLRRSLERSNPKDSIVRKLYALIVQCHRSLGQPAEALAACRAGKVHCPEDVELLFTEGLLLRERGDRAGAIACFQELLQLPAGDYFASVDTGLRGYKTRHHLAELYRELGQCAEAKAQWRAALAERPDFLPAQAGLDALDRDTGQRNNG
jgi:GT2 family glycosyltransferase